MGLKQIASECSDVNTIWDLSLCWVSLCWKSWRLALQGSHPNYFFLWILSKLLIIICIDFMLSFWSSSLSAWCWAFDLYIDMMLSFWLSYQHNIKLWVIISTLLLDPHIVTMLSFRLLYWHNVKLLIVILSQCWGFNCHIEMMSSVWLSYCHNVELSIVT